MRNSKVPKKRSNNDLDQKELDYLLKELELNTARENTITERSDQIAQIYLTTVTAIIGAVLLIIQATKDFALSSIAAFVGSAAMLAIGIFSFLRTCTYRQTTSVIQLTIFSIRQVLFKHGVQSVIVIPGNERPQTGFSLGMVRLLVMGAVFFGLNAAFTIIAGIAAILNVLGKPVFDSTTFYLGIYIFSAIFGFLICFSVLYLIIRRYRINSNIMFSKHSESLR